MSGSAIDRTALSLLGTCAAYLLFLNAGHGIAQSAVLAFACACFVRAAIDMRPRRFAASKQQAEAGIEAILAMPDADAARALRSLAFPDAEAGDGAVFLPLLKYPGSRLSPGEIYGLWREHRGSRRLIIAATCPAGPDALNCAQGLTGPSVVLADRAALAAAIRRTGLYADPRAGDASVLRRVGKRLGALKLRRASPRTLFSGFALMGTYLLTGRVLCLVLSMLLIFITGASWIRAHVSA